MEFMKEVYRDDEFVVEYSDNIDMFLAYKNNGGPKLSDPLSTDKLPDNVKREIMKDRL